MTSRRPYWCPKTMKRRPCWCPKTILCDRDLEQEIKNKGAIFLLEEQHENFVAAVTKWEMLVATNAR